MAVQTRQRQHRRGGKPPYNGCRLFCFASKFYHGFGFMYVLRKP